MSSQRYSVLAVTSQLPWPLDRGGHLRSFHLLRSVARRFRVRLVAGIRDGAACDVAAFEHAGIEVHPVRLNRRTLLTDVPRVVSSALACEPYVCFRRHDSIAVRQALQNEMTIDPPDLLYLDHLDSMLFAGVAPDTPKILDLHNVYSTLVRRTAEESRAGVAAYLRREARLLAKMERRAARCGQALLTTSEGDRRYFAALGGIPVHVVPNGVDCATYDALPAGRRIGPPIIIYVGTLSWAPNAAAAGFLVKQVLPSVRAQIPEATVRIVGRDPSPDVRALGEHPGVEVIADADDIRPHLEAAHVLAVPLESGGGSRLKILEAFAAGLPVVSTPVGCEGLDAVSGEHLLVAPRHQLADTIVRVLRDRSLADGLAERARVLARRRYDWGRIGEAACDAISAAIERRAA